MSQSKQNSKISIPDIERYYRRLIKKFGEDPRSDGYSHEFARLARFDMYMQHFDFSDKCIIDVGCGTGRLLKYLVSDSGKDVYPSKYVGIDVIGEKVIAARNSLATDGTLMKCDKLGIPVEFHHTDIANLNDYADIVLACSIFDVKQKDVPTTFKLACQTMTEMWKRCTEGIAVDFFSPYALDIQPFNAPIPPEWVFTWTMQNLNSRVLLDYTYLPHDYSVIVRKGDNDFVREWKRRGGWEREKGGEEDLMATKPKNAKDVKAKLSTESADEASPNVKSNKRKKDPKPKSVTRVGPEDECSYAEMLRQENDLAT